MNIKLRKVVFNENINNKTILMFLKNLILVSIATGLVNSVADFISTLVAGKLLSTSVLAAISLYNSIHNVFLFLVITIIIGTQLVFGKEVGKGLSNNKNQIFTVSFCLILVVVCILTALINIIPKEFAYLCGVEEEGELLNCAIDYFRGRSLGLIPSAMVSLMLVFLRTCGYDKYSLITTIELVVCTVLFSCFNALVTDNAFGAGLAISISYIIPLITVIIKMVKGISLPRFDFTSVKLNIIPDILLTGIPFSILYIGFGIRSFILNNIIYDTAGEIGIAATSIYRSVSNVADVFALCVPEAAAIIACIYVGQKNRPDFNRLIKCSAKYGLIIATASGVLTVALAGILSIMFTDDLVIAQTGARYIRLSIMYCPVYFLTTLITNIFACLKRRTTAFVINVLQSIGVCALYLVLVPLFKDNGIWLSLWIGDTCILLGVLVFMFIKNKKVSINPSVLFVDEELDEDLPKYSIALYNKNDAVSISEDICKFCIENNVDKRRATYVGLSIEELAVQVFDRSKNTNIVVSIFLRIEDDITYFLTDNSTVMDPETQVAILNPEDPCSNIGIRIVKEISKEFVWQNEIGLNSINVRI